MKKIGLLMVLVLLVFATSAQVDVLPVPNELEKSELTKQVNAYVDFVNALSKKGNPDVQKAQTIKFMKEVMAKGDVFVVNDVDTAKKYDPIKLLVYLNKLPSVGNGTLQHSIDGGALVFEKMKYDKWRRFYYAEVKVKKKLTWKLMDVQPGNSKDSNGIAMDTLKDIDSSALVKEFDFSIFFKFEKENNVSKNFRLWAITPNGQMPNLPPLDSLQLWWASLSPEWKTRLNALRKMDEFPKKSDIEKLTYQQELNFDKAAFTSYEPLSYFTNVRKLIISNSTISDFTPISKMTGLTYLDINHTQIKDIKGVEKLTHLEELYCVGLELKTIEPISSVVSLLKFDCSENDLEDISPVKELVNLKELNVSLNIKLKNIDAVRKLENMEKLSFRKIEIKDLTPVQGMKNLVYLDCFNTGITSLEPIRNLKKIFHLDLSNNKVTSLEPIRGFQYVINLYLNYSSVSDLSVVDDFTLLRKLQLVGCPQISSLGGVHKLEYLIELKCNNTKIGKDEVQRFKKNHPNCAITYY